MNMAKTEEGVLTVAPAEVVYVSGIRSKKLKMLNMAYSLVCVFRHYYTYTKEIFIFKKICKFIQ